MVEDLEIDECTIHYANTSTGVPYWNFWWYSRRDIDSEPEMFCVPVLPNGQYLEGPAGKTWALTSLGRGEWQISPSIDVYTDADAKVVRAGQSRHERSLWHHTPKVVNVPDGEGWQK